jgi:predicted alpha/beta-fold hydrolase
MTSTLAPYAQPCSPPLWARSGHGQTILSHLLPTRAEALVPGRDGVTAHDVPLPCGDRLRALHRPGHSGTMVHLFHGLSGDANADYIRRAGAVARELGHSVLAVNHRGCGDGAGLARGVYHSGRADDLAEVLAWSARRFGERQLAIGFSLSGNALLLLLEERTGTLPMGAIAINPPMDLAGCSMRISRGMNQLYDRRFVRRLMRGMRQRRERGLLPSGFQLPRARTLRELDEAITAPLGGFQDADDYYRRCSTHERLDAIDVPTVILTARDDPFVDVAPFLLAKPSDSVHLHVEPHGGHVGYLARSGGGVGYKHWLDGALRHYLLQLDPKRTSTS